jgi:hypothetical protein
MIIFRNCGCHDLYPRLQILDRARNNKLPGKAGNRPRAASRAVYTALGIPSILEESRSWEVEESKSQLGVEESERRVVDKSQS